MWWKRWNGNKRITNTTTRCHCVLTCVDNKNQATTATMLPLPLERAQPREHHSNQQWINAHSFYRSRSISLSLPFSFHLWTYFRLAFSKRFLYLSFAFSIALSSCLRSIFVLPFGNICIFMKVSNFCIHSRQLPRNMLTHTFFLWRSFLLEENQQNVSTNVALVEKKIWT